MTEFTKEQLATVFLFLAQVRQRAAFKREGWGQVCQSWARGGRSWDACGIGGTDQLMAIWWYQYRHKPGSKEWRPIIILRALIQASERDYVEPDLMPVSTVALRSTNNDRKQAYRAFVRRYDVATFHQKVKPIIRQGGVEALFMSPATPETRDYVSILAGVASGEL